MPPRILSMPRATPGPCPVCGAPHQTCTGGDPSGRYSNMFVNEQPFSSVTATEPLYRHRAGAREGSGIYELAYEKGEKVRAFDLGQVFTASGVVVTENAAAPAQPAAAPEAEKRMTSRLENKRRRVRLEDKGA